MEIATISNIAFGIGGTLLGAGAKHALETRRRKNERRSRWYSETRKYLVEAFSIGTGVLAADEISEKEIERLNSLAADLRAMGDEGRKFVEEPVANEVFDVGEVVGMYTKSVTNDDDQIGDYIEGIVESQERVRPGVDESSIEGAFEKIGGLPLGQRNKVMRADAAEKQLDTFVEELQPGMNPEDVNTLADMKDFEWGLINQQLSKKQHEEALSQAFRVYTQLALIRIPARTQNLVRASEAGEFEN